MWAGCSPQACSYKDRHDKLAELGASAIYGVSTQATDYQAEAQKRLHLPYPLLSDCELQVTRALKLPTFKVSFEMQPCDFMLHLCRGCKRYAEGGQENDNHSCLAW